MSEPEQRWVTARQNPVGDGDEYWVAASDGAPSGFSPNLQEAHTWESEHRCAATLGPLERALLVYERRVPATRRLALSPDELDVAHATVSRCDELTVKLERALANLKREHELRLEAEEGYRRAVVDCADANAELGRLGIYQELRAERVRAHAKHGETSMESMLPLSMPRLTILLEEVGEIAKEFNDARHERRDVDKAALRAELIQVAAMAAAWADALTRPLSDESRALLERSPR